MITQFILSFEVLTAQGQVKDAEYIYWQPRCDYCGVTMDTCFSMAYAIAQEAFRGAMRDGWEYTQADKRLICPVCACKGTPSPEPIKGKRGRPRKDGLNGAKKSEDQKDV